MVSDLFTCARQRKLLKVLLQHSGAAFGCICLAEDDRGLVLRAAGSSTNLKGDLDVPLTDPEAAELAPVTILAYVAQTGQTAGAKELAITSSSDLFLHQSRPGAIFAAPIRFSNVVRGVLYVNALSHGVSSLLIVGLGGSLTRHRLQLSRSPTRPSYRRWLRRQCSPWTGRWPPKKPRKPRPDVSSGDGSDLPER